MTADTSCESLVAAQERAEISGRLVLAIGVTLAQPFVTEPGKIEKIGARLVRIEERRAAMPNQSEL